MIRACLFLLCVAACGGAPKPAAPPPSNAAPAAAERTVRDVDWANRTYDLGDEGSYAVAAGHHEFAYDEDGNPVPLGSPEAATMGWFTILETAFGDVTGDGVEEALIRTELSTGGTGRFTALEVFAIRDGEPVVIGEIPGGDRGDGGLAGVEVRGGLVVVERYLSLPQDGACCPSKLQTESWAWDGARFVEDEQARLIRDNDHVY